MGGMEPRLASRHYPTAAAWRADLVVHLVGLTLALLGGGVLLALTSAEGSKPLFPIAIYAGAFVLMLACSTAYNFCNEPWRPLLRRFDHAGIFLMIAGSYTPFTTLALRGTWAWSMTAAVWLLALAGIVGKIFMSRVRETIWICLYLALGWIVLVAARPIMAALPAPALVLLVVGGLVYSAGVIFHVKEHLQFSRSIWHGHVLAGAGVHWAAILIGTVLPVTTPS
jgi:hemolysin III